MALLEQLVHTYGPLPLEDLAVSQLRELRGGLSQVRAGEVASPETARSFLDLLLKFRKGVAEADRLHGDNYPQLLQSLLSVGEDGLYSNQLRFLFELIQNVDDCAFPSGEPALAVHFDFNHDKITLRYNEEGFSPFNVFAITGIGEAAKNIAAGTTEIGEKGIGFKSVFGIASAVLIRSGWFSFKLYKEDFTIPVPAYEDCAFQPGTEMTLFVTKGRARTIYQDIKAQYCNKDALFSRNPLLFLNKLNTIRLYYDGYRSMEFHVSRTPLPPSVDFFPEKDVELSVDLRDYKDGSETRVREKIVCARYTKRMVFTQDACKSRYGEKTKVGQDGGKPMTLQAVFPLPEYVDTVGSGALYSFLPTQLRLSVPLACHVPFKLDGSREFVDPQGKNQWFKEACRAFSELLDRAYQEWAGTVKTDIVSYLPRPLESLFAENNGKEKCLSGLDFFKGAHFSKQDIFYTANGNFTGIDRIFTFDSSEHIFAPQRARELLSIPKELFLMPTPGRSIGIPTEKNVYRRLFSLALRDPKKTADVAAYLTEARFQPEKTDIPADPFSLTPAQIVSLMKWGHAAKVLMHYGQSRLKQKMRPVFQADGVTFLPIQEVLYQDFTPSEAPAEVETYLRHCKGYCALADIAAEQYLPCYNGLILSREDPLSSFSALCHDIEQKNMFSVRMALRRNTERLNQLTKSDERSPEDYLRKLKAIRQLGKEALGERQYKNYIDLILKTGTDSMRFIQELLQNADDCAYDKNVLPEFTLTKAPGKLIVAYNERGFTRENIRSITAIGESTKNYLLRHETAPIGEKGVGFKAIFSVASSVRIHSGRYHFSLSAAAPTIPELLEPPQEDVDGTRMEITLKPGVSLPGYNTSGLLELCLCLRKLRRLHINKVDIAIDDQEDSRTVFVNKRPHVFRRFVHRFSVDPAALKERENGLRTISPEQSIVCLIPDKGSAKEYPLYSGLPTKHKIKLPLVIDAPFMLTTSREEIELSGVRWNDRVRREVYAALFSIMDMRKETEGYKVLRFAKFVPRRQGTQLVYANDISDCKYLTDYDYLTELRGAALLPTFQKGVFVSANRGAACRYPDAVNHLFASGRFGQTAPETALDLPQDEALDLVLKALNCPEAPFSNTFSVLEECVAEAIGSADFRAKLYACLEAAPEDHRQSLRTLAIIPVYSQAGNETIFITWKENAIFVKKGCRKSEQKYFILNEGLLPKQSCEKIFHVNINEMNAELERSRYTDALKDYVNKHAPEEVYRFLLREYTNGSLEKYRTQEVLRGMRESLPLKNQLGQIVKNLFICKEETGYFCSRLLLAISVHDECKKLASFLGCSDLSEIHYQDLPSGVDMTTDDVEDLDTDYFLNSRELLQCSYWDGRLSKELIDQYRLDYIRMNLPPGFEGLEFPEQPVRDLTRLKAHVRALTQNPPEIISVTVPRTIQKIRYRNGREESLDIDEVRKRTLAIYTPAGKNDCAFCQMCRQAKPYAFMEVNHILPEPKHFFTETRVALCLECSKLFTAMRNTRKREKQQEGKDPFVQALQEAAFKPSDGLVDVPLDAGKSIRFTATHLAEIQEILRSVPD